MQQLKVHTSAQQQAQTYGKPKKDPLQSSVWASGPHLGPYYVFRNVLLNRNGSLTFFDDPGTALTAADLAKRSEVLPGNITKRPSMLDFEVHVSEAPNPMGHAGCHQFVKVNMLYLPCQNELTAAQQHSMFAFARLWLKWQWMGCQVLANLTQYSSNSD